MVTEVEAAGANLTLEAPGLGSLCLGRRPAAARVIFHSDAPLASLARRDHLGLAEAYLHGEIDLEGDLLEVIKVTEVMPPDPTWLERLARSARLSIRNRRRLQRESITHHYDRPPEFFLAWLDRWRSYTHGYFASPHDELCRAQARKLQFAMDALGLKAGDRVFDMGCGWGSFLEYAGRQGIRVHGITISREQHRFVGELIRRERLPCTVELANFLDFRPREHFDGAVLMGSLEHFSDYRYAARFLARHLTPEACIYTDFCTARGGHQTGAFLGRYIWPGAASYVNLPRLLRALARQGFGVHELRDDTASYALTVRAWADAFEGVENDLASRFGQPTVRAFRLFLRASQYFLERNRTQGCHLVAGRRAAPLA